MTKSSRKQRSVEKRSNTSSAQMKTRMFIKTQWPEKQLGEFKSLAHQREEILKTNSSLVHSSETLKHVLSGFSCIGLFATLWTIASQAPLSMGFPRQEYWCGLPYPSPGNLPDPGIEPESLTSPELGSRFFTSSVTREALLKQETGNHPKVAIVASSGKGGNWT